MKMENKQPNQQPTQQPVSQPMQHPMQQPMSQPNQQPMQQPMSQPNQYPIQQPMSQPNQHPMQQPMSQPMQHPIPEDFSQNKFLRAFSILLIIGFLGYAASEIYWIMSILPTAIRFDISFIFPFIFSNTNLHLAVLGGAAALFYIMPIPERAKKIALAMSFAALGIVELICFLRGLGISSAVWSLSCFSLVLLYLFIGLNYIKSVRVNLPIMVLVMLCSIFTFLVYIHSFVTIPFDHWLQFMFHLSYSGFVIWAGLWVLIAYMRKQTVGV